MSQFIDSLREESITHAAIWWLTVKECLMPILYEKYRTWGCLETNNKSIASGCFYTPSYVLVLYNSWHNLSLDYEGNVVYCWSICDFTWSYSTQHYLWGVKSATLCFLSQLFIQHPCNFMENKAPFIFDSPTKYNISRTQKYS